jgi:hypothetical protein
MARTPRNNVRTKSGDDGIPAMKFSTDKVVIEPEPLPEGYDENYDESDQEQGSVAVPSTGVVLTDEAPVTQSQLAESQMMLTKALTALVDSQPVKRVTFAKFKTRSPFNPTGNKRRKLTRRCYQNGFPMDIKKLHDEEIAMLNKLTPGKYFNQLVTVIQVQTGGNTDLHIVYENKSFDQRLALKSEFRHLREMLSIMLDEAKQRGETVVTV